MPTIQEMFPSRFLGQDDLTRSPQFTVAGVAERDTSLGGDPSFSWVMTFEEVKKPLVLNYPLALITAKELGSAKTEDWVGRTVVLYWDPYVYYNGRLTGAIRIRALQKPRKRGAKK